MAKRTLHPAMKAHGQHVKAAHAYLSKTIPSFRSQPGHQQLRAVQAHIRAGKGCK